MITIGLEAISASPPILSGFVIEQNAAVAGGTQCNTSIIGLPVIHNNAVSLGTVRCYSVSILNTAGQCVQKGFSSERIVLSTLADGIYYLIVSDSHVPVYTGRLVIGMRE
jgi:hypothetical protein